MEIDNKNIIKFLEESIRKQIEHEGKVLIEDHINKIKEEIEKRTPEIIARITVSIMKTVDMRIFEDRIIFEIRKQKES